MLVELVCNFEGGDLLGICDNGVGGSVVGQREDDFAGTRAYFGKCIVANGEDLV